MEVVEAANKRGNPVQSAIEIVKTASEASDSRIFSIVCEKCGVELEISTELGEDRAQLMLLGQPQEAAIACTQAKYKQSGDWVTNLGKRWFSVDILGPSDSSESEKNDETLAVNSTGLEIALDDAAQNLAEARKIRDGTSFSGNADDATRLEGDVGNVVNLFDLVLSPHQDGKSWRSEVEERSAEM